jgi:nitrous oxidase accessory protein NosD
VNNLVRQTLSEIINKYGRAVADDPRRMEALLRDHCGQYKKEINVLVGAMKERVAAELMASSTAMPEGVLRARLTRRLHDNLGLSEEASRWAVETWAIALGAASILEPQVGGASRGQSTAQASHAEASQAEHENDPDDPFADVAQADHSPTPPEEILRQAIRVILADDYATEYEKADLRVIRQRLGLSVDEARRIFAEVKSERPQPAKTRRAGQPTLVVEARGGGQYRTISDAIMAAPPGAHIVVRPGLYRESLVIDKPLEIFGDGPAGQIIIESADSPCAVMRADHGVLKGLYLRGLTSHDGNEYFAVDISYGELLLEGCDITNESGGCVLIHGPEVNPVIRQCKIRDGEGYGIWVWDDATAMIESCEIYNNAGAGVVVSGDTMREAREMAAYVLANAVDYGQEVEDILAQSPNNTGPRATAKARTLIRRCNIYDGRDHGVWVHYGGRGDFEHCRIIGNASAGAWVDQNSESVIRHCGINRNGWEAIRVTGESSAIVEDCDLSANAGGAWSIEPGCRVRQSSNQE